MAIVSPAESLIMMLTQDGNLSNFIVIYYFRINNAKTIKITHQVMLL